MSAFALEALGRYQEAAAEWHHIIGWLEAHGMTVHTRLAKGDARRNPGQTPRPQPLTPVAWAANRLHAHTQNLRSRRQEQSTGCHGDLREPQQSALPRGKAGGWNAVTSGIPTPRRLPCQRR